MTTLTGSQDRPIVKPPEDCPFCGEPMKVLRQINGMPVAMGCDCDESRIFMEGLVEDHVLNFDPEVEDDGGDY